MALQEILSLLGSIGEGAGEGLASFGAGVNSVAGTVASTLSAVQNNSSARRSELGIPGGSSFLGPALGAISGITSQNEQTPMIEPFDLSKISLSGLRLAPLASGDQAQDSSLAGFGRSGRSMSLANQQGPDAPPLRGSRVIGTVTGGLGLGGLGLGGGTSGASSGA